MWALGVILYILLCGFAPFRSRDRDQEELFEIIKRGHLHFLSPYWDTISEEAKGLVSGLIQSDPVTRMTAQNTLQHPWLRAKVASCQAHDELLRHGHFFVKRTHQCEYNCHN
uniref:Protein kinase domain-containing protein n=1 Tax=Hippocampus comes TaxID=109280 RepID=A0A3Q2XH35_HIPCM